MILVLVLVLEKIKMDTKGHTIILASGSPRRQQFFKEMKIPFIKKVIPVKKVFHQPYLDLR